MPARAELRDYGAVLVDEGRATGGSEGFCGAVAEAVAESTSGCTANERGE